MITKERRRRSLPPIVCDPGCDCDYCIADREAREQIQDDELNNGAGCGPWMLLVVGYIVALTAIGISLISLAVDLEFLTPDKATKKSPAESAVPRSSWAHRTQARKAPSGPNAQAEGEATAAFSLEIAR